MPITYDITKLYCNPYMAKTLLQRINCVLISFSFGLLQQDRLYISDVHALSVIDQAYKLLLSDIGRLPITGARYQ